MKMEIVIYLHSGQSFKVNVSEYNAEVLARELNNRENMVIAIGDLVINKNSINLVSPSDKLKEILINQ